MGEGQRFVGDGSLAEKSIQFLFFLDERWAELKNEVDSQNEISNKQSKCGGRDNYDAGTLWVGIGNRFFWHWEHIGLTLRMLMLRI